MRCRNCGKKIKNKKSSFCMNCGAKLPPISKKDKKAKIQKKRLKARIIIPVLIVLILALLTFLLYGGDKVPEQIRSQKGYSYLTGAVKDKLPDRITLPLDLPFIGSQSGREPDGKKTEEAPDGVQGSKENLTSAEKKSEEPARIFTAEEEKIMKDGVEEAAVLNNEAIYATVSSPDWIYSTVKIREHRTDVIAGTDTVVVYLEMENKYVKMTGTREITYRFNGQTDQWEAGQVSKIAALSIEPVGNQQ